MDRETALFIISVYEVANLGKCFIENLSFYNIYFISFIC